MVLVKRGHLWRVLHENRALDRTGGADVGLVVPERAVAGRCVEAQADVARPSRGRLTQRGPARQPDDPKAAQANTAARSSGSVSERRPNART